MKSTPLFRNPATDRGGRSTRPVRALLVASLACAGFLGACGDPGAKITSKSEPSKTPGTHTHNGSDPNCPMCKSLKEQADAAQTKETGVLDITMKSIEGKDVNLAQFKGKVVMIVNVASKCGFTKQYKGLQALYDAKKDQGLVVLGFPANDFLGQEPGTNEEIAQLCSGTYGVTFPMFAKISVVGETQHELYKRLTLAAAEMGGQPGWNFTKYIVGRDGKLAARFKHSVSPDDKDLVAKVDELLGQK